MAASAAPDAEPLTVVVQSDCPAPGLPDPAAIRDWLGLTLREAGNAVTPGAEVVVRVVDEAESRALNHEYRGVDRPTNVLAFPAELDALPGLPSGDEPSLGDIVLCAEVVANEARQQGKRATDHFAHLIVHGTLHLLGYDHESSEDADRMERLEARILAQRGLQNPY